MKHAAQAVRYQNGSGLRLIMFYYLANGGDHLVDFYAAIQRPSYVATVRRLAKSQPDEAWLLTNRPIFGIFTARLSGGQPARRPRARGPTFVLAT